MCRCVPALLNIPAIRSRVVTRYRRHHRTNRFTAIRAIHRHAEHTPRARTTEVPRRVRVHRNILEARPTAGQNALCTLNVLVTKLASEKNAKTHVRGRAVGVLSAMSSIIRQCALVPMAMKVIRLRNVT